LINAKVRNYS